MWVLIIILMTSQTAYAPATIGTVVAEFSDREACDAAWRTMQRTTDDSKEITNTIFTCLPKSSRDPGGGSRE